MGRLAIFRKMDQRHCFYIAMLLLTVFWGCSGPIMLQSRPQQLVQSMAPAKKAGQAAPVMAEEPYTPAEGSLWDERSDMGQMFVNPKAHRIGDIVTVKIVETSSATNKASTKTGRTTSLTAGLNNFFNLEQRYPSTRPFFNPFSSVQGSYQSDFDGSGTTIRSGALTAYMTARVVDILPNGDLMIEGNREVRVNNDNQIITLTGIVRPRDISAQNIVQSTYIADARITYSGTGVLNDRQKPGWLTRILDKVWPF